MPTCNHQLIILAAETKVSSIRGRVKGELTFKLHLEDLQEDAIGCELVEHAPQELSRHTDTVAGDDQATSVNEKFTRII